jgi:hypothetical protein
MPDPASNTEKPPGCRDDRILERGLAGEHVVQRDLGHEVQHDVEVRKAEVGVQHEHALAATRQGGGQVGRQKGLADPALAARHREHARAMGLGRRIGGGSCVGLIHSSSSN